MPPSPGVSNTNGQRTSVSRFRLFLDIYCCTCISARIALVYSARVLLVCFRTSQHQRSRTGTKGEGRCDARLEGRPKDKAVGTLNPMVAKISYSRIRHRIGRTAAAAAAELPRGAVKTMKDAQAMTCGGSRGKQRKEKLPAVMNKSERSDASRSQEQRLRQVWRCVQQ